MRHGRLVAPRSLFMQLTYAKDSAVVGRISALRPGSRRRRSVWWAFADGVSVPEAVEPMIWLRSIDPVEASEAW